MNSYNDKIHQQYSTRSCLREYVPGYQNILTFWCYIFVKMLEEGLTYYQYLVTYRQGSILVYIGVRNPMLATICITVQQDEPVNGQIRKLSYSFELRFPFHAPTIAPGGMDRIRELLDPLQHGGQGASPFEIFVVIDRVRPTFHPPRGGAPSKAKKSVGRRDTRPLDERRYFSHFRRLAADEHQSPENQEQIRKYGTPEMQAICDRFHMTTCWIGNPPRADLVRDEDFEEECDAE